MRSSSSPSAESGDSRDETLSLMRQRFVEALRRAEVIALVNAAETEDELGRALTDELCEVYDAEIAILIEPSADPAADRVIAATGAHPAPGAPVLDPELRRLAMASEGPVEASASVGGTDAERVLAIKHAGQRGRWALLCVARLYAVGFDPSERALLAAVSSGVGHALERLWAHEELQQASLATAAALANAMEARDDYTAGHARQIAELATVVGERMGLDAEALEDLRWAAVFHDIGKIAVADEILLKPGPLTPRERGEMERHVIVGEQILEPIPFRAAVRRCVRHSHERWDGGGYPDGLAGDEIPLGSRIISVVDAWHAMRSDRPYRKAIGEAEALAELRANAGTQFDPAAVEAFLDGR